MNNSQTGRLTRSRILLIAALFVGCDSGSEALVGPEVEAGTSTATFTITSKPIPVSATRMEGTFEAVGFIQDQGALREEVDSAEPLVNRTSIHGVKTLESDKGTIRIEFYASLLPAGPGRLRARGGFTITEGSNAYEGIVGGGEIDHEIASNASAAAITSILSGRAQFEQ